MSWFEKLDEKDLGESAKRILRAKESERTGKRMTLIVFLVVILISTLFLFFIKILDKQTFQLIWTSIVGGFVGASVNMLFSE